MGQILRKIPVISRLYPSILKRWPNAPLISGYRIRKYRGLSLILDYRNALDRNVGLRGAYEEQQFAYFLPRIEKGCDLFLDIGACCGLYALQAAKMDAVKEVHAFEPDPRNFSHMMGNIMINELSDRISAHAFALSDTAGTVRFELGDSTKTGLSRVANENSNAQRVRTVESRRADDVFTCKGKKIFIKLDVEGHEMSVLKGAEQLLRNNDCVLQIEAWRDNAPALIKAMEGLGYKNVHVIGDDHYFEK